MIRYHLLQQLYVVFTRWNFLRFEKHDDHSRSYYKQLWYFIFQCIRRAISHFSFQSNCQQLQWRDVLHMQKPCGINHHDEGKILLSRASFPFTLPFFWRFLVSHTCHVRQLSARKSAPLRLLSRRGASRMNKNSSRTLPYFRTVITTLIRPAVKSNPEIRSARMRICMKIESWRKTCRRIFRICKFTRERNEIFFCVQTFITTQTDNELSVCVVVSFHYDSSR